MISLVFVCTQFLADSLLKKHSHFSSASFIPFQPSLSSKIPNFFIVININCDLSTERSNHAFQTFLISKKMCNVIATAKAKSYFSIKPTPEEKKGDFQLTECCRDRKNCTVGYSNSAAETGQTRMPPKPLPI